MSEKNIKSFIDELIKEVEDELDEANVTGNVDGYDTPHAFSGKNSDKKRKKTATQFGYTLVNNDINNIDESINEDTKRVNILGIDFNISEMNGRIFFSFIDKKAASIKIREIGTNKIVNLIQNSLDKAYGKGEFFFKGGDHAEFQNGYLFQRSIGNIKLNKLKFESVNEAKPSVVGNMNAYGPSKVLGKGGEVLGFVPDTPNAIATLIQDYPTVQAIEFKSSFFFNFNSYKSIKKGDKAWKELMSRGVDKATKAALKKDFELKESVNEEALPKDGSTIKVSNIPVKIEYVSNKKYIGYSWKDKNNKEHYEETKTSDHSNLNSLIKTIKINLDESVNEAKFKSPDYIISTTPASSLPEQRLGHADVMIGLKLAEKLKNYTLHVRHYKLIHADGKVALKLTPEGKTAIRVRTENDPKYLQLIQKTVNDVVADYVSKIKESVNEAFKHIIHVDTPTQVVSKPIAAQILALAKKGVRSKEIGLEMGFVGNAKLAADTFQKIKNKIYFELDKRESVNEALDPKAEKFLDAIQVNDRSIKDLKNITVDTTPQGNWSVYYKGKRMFTLNGKMLDDKTIMKYGLEHMDESLSEGKSKRPVNRWLELKNDESMHANKKLATGLRELKYQLKEVETFFRWYNQIKTMNELSSDTFWKRTHGHIYKIKERLINIAKTIQEIEK